MELKKKHKVFIDGPITPAFISDSIAKHSSKTNIGAHAIFLGQIRQDDHDGKKVSGIEYSAYSEMAENIIHEIRESAFKKYPVICMHIYHSTGLVKASEISLFVFVSCKYRKESFAALEEIVEKIKIEVPIWKKEIYEDGSYKWIDGKP